MGEILFQNKSECVPVLTNVIDLISPLPDPKPKASQVSNDIPNSPRNFRKVCVLCILEEVFVPLLKM